MRWLAAWVQAHEVVRHVPSDDATDDGGDGAAAGAAAADVELMPTELDFELLSELFEMKSDNLSEVLWYLNVFLRAAGHPDGIQGKMAVRLLKSLGRIGKVRVRQIRLH